jgi:hypothetical protein
MPLRYQDCIREKNKNRFNSGIACYHRVKSLLKFPIYCLHGRTRDPYEVSVWKSEEKRPFQIRRIILKLTSERQGRCRRICLAVANSTETVMSFQVP